MAKKIPADVYWYTLKDPQPSAELAGEVEADAVVIGGGVAGLTCAQRLQAAGKQVVVLERDFCGAGASGKTSGFVTPDSEIELSTLLGAYGPKQAKRMWEFVTSGVETLRQNIERYQISCGYQPQDSLFVANGAAGLGHVKREHEARQQLGYEDVMFDKTTVREVIGSQAYAGAVKYPQTFGMNSYLYCQAMKENLRRAGVQIFEKTSATSMAGGEVLTARGRVQAGQIMVCADRFIPDLGALKSEIYHIQTFLGMTKPLAPEQVRQIFPGKALMVWDTDLIYNYFRLTDDNRLLIGGGDLLYTYASQLSDNTARFGRRLTNYLRKKFPKLKFELEYLWPGMLGVSKDFLPVMGPDEKNDKVFYVGAATGLPWAAALGGYAADRWLAGRREFDEDFSPRRRFVIGPRMQSWLGTPLTYALAHGITKKL